MPTVAIYNPVCGDGTAKAFVDEHVVPYLTQHNKPLDKIIPTEGPGHAGTALAQYLESTEGEVTVILASGDGTLHEIINALSSVQLKGKRAGLPPSRLYFVLIPCGTANALYSSIFPPTSATADAAYRLQSLAAFVGGSGTPIPLTLAITTLSSAPSARARPRAVVSTVVVSTALHAAILHDSEALRAEIPSIERFKVAARQNSARWYSADVKLLPAPGAKVVQVYDPVKKAFVAHERSTLDDPIVDLDGPFAYFLSVVNVDRLEPQFRIAPLEKKIIPEEAAFDIVVLRPMEDPAFELDTPEAREAFAKKAWAVMGAAYEDGKHVELRYDEEGNITEQGDGPAVVEYFRCGGWEWIPYEDDDAAHLLCTDGAIATIEKGGRAVCTAANPSGSAGFMLHA